jgi:UPF0755 protein
MAGGRRKKKDGSYHSENYFSTHRDFGVLPRSPAEALEPDYAPEPPELVSSWHQRPLVKFLNNVMTLLFVGVIGLALLLYYVRTQYDQPGPLDYATVVVIPKGDGVRQIASRLEREEIISDQRIFVAFVMYFGAQIKVPFAVPVRCNISGVKLANRSIVEARKFFISITSWAIVRP